MPRTKVKRNTTKQEKESEDDNLRLVLECIRKKKLEILEKLEEEKNKVLDAYQIFKRDEKTSIPHKYLNLTVKEITELEKTESTGSVSCLSKLDLVNLTKSSRKERHTIKRSASFVDDEGYLTAESVTSGGRKSRTMAKLHRPSRMSRSLSRTNIQKTYKTPANKKTPPDSYGLVTPKCKPNTPQILLRRPKDGEVALSMQGSPLYTASVVNEKVANINIPLLDGRLLTLQPQRGLRVSQIPQFDPETLRQLETLRENLGKVCEASGIMKK